MIGVSVATLRNWEQGGGALAMAPPWCCCAKAVAEALHRPPKVDWR